MTGILSERSQQVNTLILNANDLLAVLNDRRQAIVSLLANTSAVSRQLTGLVADNEKELAPTLERLNRVNAMLEKNRDNIAKALPGLAKYELTQGEIVSNGAYYNALIPNISPAQILQPFLDYAFGFRRGVDAGQPPDNAGPRAEIPFPVNGIPATRRPAAAMNRSRLVTVAAVAPGRRFSWPARRSWCARSSSGPTPSPRISRRPPRSTPATRCGSRV